MSVPVELSRLREEIERFGPRPYLITVGADRRPHAVSADVSWRGDELLAPAGRATSRNVAESPVVTLLWPPHEPDGYSLIVDGQAVVEGEGDDGRAVVTVEKAVLHRTRPAPTPTDPNACGMDCVPVTG